MGRNHPVRARSRPGFPLRPKQPDVCISARADTYFNKRLIREDDVDLFRSESFGILAGRWRQLNGTREVDRMAAN
jgi:hypothetical protein